MKLIKLPRVSDLSALQTTKIYDSVNKGLFPSPVKIAARSVAWPEAEVMALVAARIAGKTDEEIRKLVADLKAARAQALPQQLAQAS